MSAPHEEAWEIVTQAGYAPQLRHAGRLVAEVSDIPRATLAHAAPDMARALLEHVEACDSCRGKGVISVRDGNTRTDGECPGCSDDREVLRKAGVLP